MTCGGGGSTIALSMLSLVAGTFLLIKTCKEEMCCKWFPKIVAYAVIVISILMILCGGYWRIVKFGHHGWGRHGMGKPGMMGGMMMKDMDPEMMQKMMANCPMMKMMRGAPGGEEDRDE